MCIYIYKCHAAAMLFLYTSHNNGLREQVSIRLWCGLSHWMIGVLSHKTWNVCERSPWIFWPLKMKPSRCLESLGTSYPVMQHHIPEEQRQLLWCQPPKTCNIREVKYFCTCVANHSFSVLCFHVNVTCILEIDTAAGFILGNWKCKSEVVHGVLQFESGCLMLECLLTLWSLFQSSHLIT